VPWTSSSPSESEKEHGPEETGKQDWADERGHAKEEGDQTEPVEGPDFGHLLYVHVFTDLI
jgi:hypothetical protein